MKISKIAGFAIPLALIACGDSGTTENITNNYTSGMEIVDLVSSLPKCTADNEGDQVWVKEKGAASICVAGRWESLGGAATVDTVYVSDGKFACTTEPLADGSGVNILCNDEVIGTVLNGKDGSDGAQGIQGVQGVAGADGKDGLDGAGCKVVGQTAESVTIQCGDDKFNMNLNGGSGEIIEPVEEVVSLEKLNGVSQKGPFINGSTVTLFELDGSRSLVQTGRTFGGEIITDDGRFSVNNVSLKSSYVRLTANGFYRNEVSGKNSTSSIVLNAYSDLQARSSVNINLLTHLEYYRVGYLMENGLESTIKASKKRAQKEIFAAFGIDNDGFGYSEDLDVFGVGDQNAALLAMSILLQGDRSEADLSALLANFGKDIEEDGTWDDKATRAKIADWADSVDLGLKDGLTLPKIKDNVSRWGLGSVPAFEKYVRNFWYMEYGLGDCNESNANVVVRDTNSKSAYYSSKYAYDGSTDKKVRYTCDDKDSLGKSIGEFRWRRASNIEKDIAGWGHDFNTGDVRNGRVNTNLVYVYEDDNWRHGTAIDSLMFKLKADGGKACTKGSLNDTSAVKVNGLYYVCATGDADTSYRWVKAPDVYNDVYEARSSCTAATDGDLMNGRVNTSKVYACNGTTGWREVTDGQSKTLGGCYTNLIDSVGLYSGAYYVCRSNGWVEAAEIVYDTYGQKCSSEEVGKVISGKLTATNKYYCSTDGWKSLMGDWSWEYPKEARMNPEIDYGIMTDIRDNQTYRTVTIGTQTWMAENLNYDYNEGTAKSYCYDNEESNCKVTGRLYLWPAAMDSAAVFSEAGKGCGYRKTCDVASRSSMTVVRGVCPEGWHLPSNSDWETLWTAVGGTSTAGTKLKSTSGWYENGNGNGIDTYGFSVLPAGSKNDNGNFGNLGAFGSFWSSTENDGYNAYYVYFDIGKESVGEYNYYKGLGLSVRCLKD